MASDARHPADKFCRRMLKTYPRATAERQHFEAERDSFGAAYPAWCGLPMAATYAIITSGADVEIARQYMAASGKLADLPRLTAALIWSTSKVVYRYDADLAAMLLDQPMDDSIPIDTLYRMPYYCLYIETDIRVMDIHADGFFAWMECDAQTLVPELRILYLLHGGGTYSLPVILSGGTIDDSLAALHASVLDRAPDDDARRIAAAAVDSADDMMHRLASGAINLILYILSIDGDRVCVTQRRPAPDRSTGVQPAIQSWDVGIRMGAALRAWQAAQEHEIAEASSGARTAKRPHVRRAHWHHYWQGPADARALTVRWLPPIPVGFTADADMPAVIRRVDG